MGIGTLLVGSGLAAGVSSVAKTVLQASVGQKIAGASLKKYGWGAGFVPFTGVLKAAYNIPRVIKEYAGMHGAFSKTLGAIKGPMKGGPWYGAEVTEKITQPIQRLLKERMPGNFRVANWAARNVAHDVSAEYGDLLRGSAKMENPLSGLVKESLLKQGFTTGSVSLTDASVNAIENSLGALRAAHASKRLIGPTLMSNMAVVGTPALSSGIMTSALVGAMRRKGRNRMRGYE